MNPGPALILAALLGADLTVPTSGSLTEALARARPGDTVRLERGQYHASLGRPVGLRLVGAGAGVTVLTPPPGEDGAVATGSLALVGLTLVAGPSRCALKVLGGAVTLDDVALVGGACGAFVSAGQLDGREVWLEGNHGLLQSGGTVRLRDVTARGRYAGLAVMSGTLEVDGGAVTGPSREAGVTVAGGSSRLSRLVIRDPGPTGLAVSGASVEARDLTIAGPHPEGVVGGDCVQVQRGQLRLFSSELVRCGGASLEASRAELLLDGVDAGGGEAGGLVLVDHSRAELRGTLSAGRGPGLVLMQGSTARSFGARLWTDPAAWVDCGSGSRWERIDAPSARQTCTPAQ